MSNDASSSVRHVIERIIREEWSYTLSALVYRIRDFQLAEDSLQDSIIVAWKKWPLDGIPKQPRAWLFKTAYRKAIDHIRRRESFSQKTPEIEHFVQEQQIAGEEIMDTEIPDERLRMIFTCCHPALEKQTSVALTLRTCGGLDTREIAKAFLVEESTMAQRLTRAKRKIRKAAIPYRVPPPELWPERFEAVLSVIYLIFNEGYLSSSDTDLLRADLCQEAIRLTRILIKLTPRECEAEGLLALMLLHDSRRLARKSPTGEMITLEDQDRSLWIQENIYEGDEILHRTLPKGKIGPYQIQAAVSAIHAQAAEWKQTDWPQISELYKTLYRLQPSPVVRLNEAVARSMVDGPKVGLQMLIELEKGGDLINYQPFFAAKADFLNRLNRHKEALETYRIAIAKSSNRAEKCLLQKKIDSLEKT